MKSIGLIELCLRTSHTIPNIMVLMDIFTVNVTALFGLHVLDAESLYANNVTNPLEHRKTYSRSRQ